jgi:alcohol dehydrogenase
MSATAQAVVLTAPRTLELREFPIPQTGDADGLLRIEACGLCGSDWEQYLGHLKRGLPIIPGHEILGVVEKLGAAARDRWGLRPGDRVAVDASVPCGTCRECVSGSYKRCPNRLGYGIHVRSDVAPHLWGGYATHAYLHPRALLQKVPDDVPTATMTLFNPLSNAVGWVLEVGGVGVDSSVVICGPGQRGLLGVVAAREAGASEIIVTGTKHDAHRLALARKLGATATIDVDAEDPVAIVRERTKGALVDVVVDMSAGGTAPVVQAMDMVRPGGTVVLAGMKGDDRPVNGLLSDKIVMKEIRVLGARSSGQSATAKAIKIIAKHVDELAVLCTHAYDLPDANKAVLVLGREVIDGPEAVHVHINGARS